jgi:hypothetical protein
MTATQILERRIIHQLLQAPAETTPGGDAGILADRLIRGLAAGASLVVLLSWVPGLAWLGLGAATVWALGVR